MTIICDTAGSVMLLLHNDLAVRETEPVLMSLEICNASGAIVAPCCHVYKEQPTKHLSRKSETFISLVALFLFSSPSFGGALF